MNYSWTQVFIVINLTLYLSQNYPNIFRCSENVLIMSVSKPKPIDSNKKFSDLVKEETIWSSFLCILALASVTSLKINCYYPYIGSICYRAMIIWIIQSRILQMSLEDVHISFSYEEVLRSCLLKTCFEKVKKPPLKRKSLN